MTTVEHRVQTAFPDGKEPDDDDIGDQVIINQITGREVLLENAGYVDCQEWRFPQEPLRSKRSKGGRQEYLGNIQAGGEGSDILLNRPNCPVAVQMPLLLPPMSTRTQRTDMLRARISSPKLIHSLPA